MNHNYSTIRWKATSWHIDVVYVQVESDRVGQLKFVGDGELPLGWSNPWYTSEKYLRETIQRGYAEAQHSGLEMEEGF